MPIIIGRPNGSSGGSGNPSPDQEARLVSIEAVNTQQNTRLDSIQAKDIEQDTQLSSLNSKVDGAVATTASQAERISALEDSYVDYAPTIQAIQTKNTEQDGAITLANGKNDAQDLRLDSAESLLTSHASRLTSAETSIANKADLVSGKIPLAQLPDLPVGRKVSVDNKAARLALEVHPDLTIAYEADTADAWALDAGEDPSVEANWDKLGNAQATGVQSFNGRTGNVVPQAGDYTAALITETTDRTFISPNDRTRWDEKATVVQVLASVSDLRTEVEAGYIKTSTRGANNGTATLGPDGKVPIAQLPPLGLTAAQSQRIDQIESNTLLANAKGDSAATNILAVDNRLTQVDNDSKNRDIAQNTRLTALETANSNYIPTSQKSAANGVAPLNANSIVPTVNLPINRTNGIPGLNADARVLSENLPTYLPQSAREWRNETSSRVKGTWYTNNSGNEMVVHCVTTNANDGGYINFNIRKDSNSSTMNFIGSSVGSTTGGASTRAFNTITVPQGWQYAVNSSNLGSRVISTWYELS